MLPSVSIDSELVPLVVLGVLQFDGVRVVVDETRSAPDPPADTRELANRIEIVRAMYRRFGVDPTKTRPSSEALLRRVRRALPWPVINTLVDTCNECSLATQLPFGLYDVDRIVGNVILRRGRSGEEYEGIRKAHVHLAGRPALFDEQGPFGNPTSDSARTMVTPATTRALIVVYAPCELRSEALAEALELTASRVWDTTSGLEQGRAVVSGSMSAGS